MQKEPWKYWDRRVLEAVVWFVQDYKKKLDLTQDATDPALVVCHSDIDSVRRALDELLFVLGFSTVLNHPTTQPVGMGEESAP